MRHIHTVRVALVGLLAPLALVACGSDDDAASTTDAPAASEAPAPAATEAPAAPAATEAAPAGTDAGALPEAGAGGELVIKDFAFAALSTTAGSEISLSNQDGFAHTVTADDGTFSVQVDGGATATLTIDAAGTYTIHCNIHPSMTGTIEVA